jgi:hypothetical protein
MDDRLKRAVTKIFNSDIVKNVYPMIDRIEINRMDYNINLMAYDMSVNVFLNDPTIDKNNMYSKNFDPHYLIQKYISELSKYFDLLLHNITFKVFGPDGDLILNWD